ncbi:chitinase [Pseudocitrobacter cyperus]|uniref:Chitinase n=1 Tax=Pseudocitrobacter cyperus TaxID=3112843 RepID=A0ABV0HIE1_9ENTR
MATSKEVKGASAPTVTIKTSKINVQSWYQKVTVTLTNSSDSAVDINHAQICFRASGHPDPWGNIGGTLKGNQPLTLHDEPQGNVDANTITINNSGALLLHPGKSGTLFFSFASTQVPLVMSDFSLKLVGMPEEQEEEDIEQPEEEIKPAPQPEPEKIPEPVSGEGITISASELNRTSWYQRVVFTIANHYSCAIDLNKLNIQFTASAHPDPYSPFAGSALGDQAPILASDGGWPVEKNSITLHNSAEKMLPTGRSATLECYLAATQTPLVFSDLQATLARDPGRQGKIVLSFPSLASELKPMVELLHADGKSQMLTGNWGESLSIDNLAAGQYRVRVLTLQNEVMQLAPVDEMIAVTLLSSADVQYCQVAYQPVVMFASAELMLACSPLTGGEVTAEIWSDDGKCVRTLPLTVGNAAKVETLISGQRYEIRLLSTVINNQIITTPAHAVSFVATTGEACHVSVGFQQTAVDTHGFVNVRATVLGLPEGVGPQRYRLRTRSGQGEFQYVVALQSDSFQQTLPFIVSPGQYSVEVADVSWQGGRWRCEALQPLRLLQATNAITLSFEKSIPLQVRGWPAYLAHGGVTVNAAETTTLYRDVPFSALFKYDGFDGGGDPIPAREMDLNGDGFLDANLLPVHKTVALTRQIEKEAKRAVMPVMVIYTANASGGSALSDLQDNQKLHNHFGNFITQCLTAQSYKDAEHPVPATFVLNPDFLGAIEQEPYGYTVVRQKNSVQVNAQLAAAVRELASLPGFNAPALPVFSDDLYGYVQAINYIVRHFAPDVAFGWQTNVWATGTADWLLRDNADPLAQGNQIADFIQELGVYTGHYIPDFIAFDKFERDCFSPDAIAHYAWNARCWLNYLEMVRQTAKRLSAPAMLWQIPGGHMPTIDEGTSKLTATHFASGGTFFMGDKRIGSNIAAITPDLLNSALNPATYGVSTVGQFLAKDQGYDWGQMQALNLPDYNVFSVLWGGGSTVSITTIHSNGEDGGWLADKMREYYAAPRYFY